MQDVSLTAASPAQCSVSRRGGSPGTPPPPAGSSAGCTSAAAAKTRLDTVTGVPRAGHPRSGDGRNCCRAAPICAARKGPGSTSGNLPPQGTRGWEGRCFRSPAGLVGQPTARPQRPAEQADDRQRESSPSPSARLRDPCATRRAQPPTHLEQVEIHLLGVRVLLLVHRHEEVFHVHHHAQQPVDLLLRDVLQVGHVVRCDGEKAAVRMGGQHRSPSLGGSRAPRRALPSAWLQLRQGSLRLVTGCCRSMRGAVGGLGFFQPLHLQASLAWDEGQERPSRNGPAPRLPPSPVKQLPPPAKTPPPIPPTPAPSSPHHPPCVT